MATLSRLNFFRSSRGAEALRVRRPDCSYSPCAGWPGDGVLCFGPPPSARAQSGILAGPALVGRLILTAVSGTMPWPGSRFLNGPAALSRPRKAAPPGSDFAVASVIVLSSIGANVRAAMAVPPQPGGTPTAVFNGRGVVFSGPKQPEWRPIAGKRRAIAGQLAEPRTGKIVDARRPHLSVG